MYLNPNMVSMFKKTVCRVGGNNLVEVETCSANERICESPLVEVGEFTYIYELLVGKFGVECCVSSDRAQVSS